MRSLLLGLSHLFVAACSSAATAATPSRTLGPGEQWVPAAPASDVLCPLPREIGGAALVLTGSPSDPRLVWLLHVGQQFELDWPVGYSARFTPKLELMNENDQVVGRGGMWRSAVVKRPLACGALNCRANCRRALNTRPPSRPSCPRSKPPLTSRCDANPSSRRRRRRSCCPSSNRAAARRARQAPRPRLPAASGDRPGCAPRPRV